MIASKCHQCEHVFANGLFGDPLVCPACGHHDSAAWYPLTDRVGNIISASVIERLKELGILPPEARESGNSEHVDAIFEPRQMGSRI